MLFAIMFAFWRFMQVVTLIPTMGMLAYFVNGFDDANMLTPAYILLLFIVSVLGVVWAIATLFSYHRSSSNARFVSLIDLGFVGTLIAAAYRLRFIRHANCAHIRPGDYYDTTFSIFGSSGGASVPTDLDVQVDKTCAMLKASWAFAIMNCIFFAITAILAWMHGDRTAAGEKRHYTETHYRSSRRHANHGNRNSQSRSRAYV